jgi:hypothetical protein
MDRLIKFEKNTITSVVSRFIFIAKKSPPTIKRAIPQKKNKLNEPKIPIPGVESIITHLRQSNVKNNLDFSYMCTNLIHKSRWLTQKIKQTYFYF